MDAWENCRTQQSGPSVDRILENGPLVFPKLDSLEVSATVDFYDKLHKTSALFLLPLMLFDAINLNTGFEGLCPPGLGLQRYAEIAGVLMEVLPRLLPTSDSQVTSLVTVVQAESNNGFDLLWRILELAVFTGSNTRLSIYTVLKMIGCITGARLLARSFQKARYQRSIATSTTSSWRTARNTMHTCSMHMSTQIGLLASKHVDHLGDRAFALLLLLLLLLSLRYH